MIRKYKPEDDDELPIACSALLVALSSEEENCSDLCHDNKLLSGLVKCMKCSVRVPALCCVSVSQVLARVPVCSWCAARCVLV